jgi:hypothetical protein
MPNVSDRHKLVTHWLNIYKMTNSGASVFDIIRIGTHEPQPIIVPNSKRVATNTLRGENIIASVQEHSHNHLIIILSAASGNR